jgi:hypothetical protein
MYDLVFRGGSVVTAGSLGRANVGVDAGRVVQLGGDMRGRREITAHRHPAWSSGSTTSSRGRRQQSPAE